MKRIILICTVAALIFAIVGCTEPQSTVPDSSQAAPVETSIVPEVPNPDPEPEPESEWESLDDLLGSHEWTAEAGTSGRVDEIIMAASADAAAVTDDILVEAQNRIAEKYPDFFADEETMEQLMYCGRLLEKACSEDSSLRNNATLGMNTVQAIKYVYRGAETVADEATQINLEEVGETLKLIGLVD